MKRLILAALAATAVVTIVEPRADAAYSQTFGIEGVPYPLNDTGCWSHSSGSLVMTCSTIFYHAWAVPLAITYSPSSQTINTYTATYLPGGNDEACYQAVAANEKGLVTAYTSNVCLVAGAPFTNSIGSLTIPSGGAAYMNFVPLEVGSISTTGATFVSVRWGT